MPKKQAKRLGTTVLVVSLIINFFTAWALFPAFIGWTLIVYGTSE
jgi:hypothetical protein